MSEIPQWAKQRACDLVNETLEPGLCHYTPAAVTVGNKLLGAFAVYIAEHEQPPVDPLVDVFAHLGLVDPQWSGAKREAEMFRAELTKRGLQIVPSDA